MGNEESGNIKYIPLIQEIDKLLTSQERVLVAIDGNSGAGKSSLAGSLNKVYSCNVISMDSFFLRPEQRTAERLSEPGGNIDYERFDSEVSEPLKAGESFSYRPYDCRTMELAEPVDVKHTPLTVVEGVYSMHPFFTRSFETDSFYNLSVFLRLDKNEQHRRLGERNPHLLERFISEWIPMENMYFDYFKISEKCTFVIDT